MARSSKEKVTKRSANEKSPKARNLESFQAVLIDEHHLVVVMLPDHVVAPPEVKVKFVRKSDVELIDGEPWICISREHGYLKPASWC